MIIPQKLKKGDKIGIISTARRISFKELNPAIQILESWGLEVSLGKNIFKSNNQFAGTIQERVNDLQTMIDDASIKAIFCARGGYGTVQLIDKVNFSNLIKSPKWIVGYSDITVLHSHLNNLNIASLHATMPINFKNNTKESIESLKNVVFKMKTNIRCKPNSLNKLGSISGEVVGGNLSILYSLVGSVSDINTDGKILFIEDLDEYLYHIDRMIISFKRNNKFKNLNGLIVGSMSDMNDNIVPFGQTAEEIILDHTKDYDFPICFGFPSGHTENNNAILFGLNSELNIAADEVLLIN